MIFGVMINLSMNLIGEFKGKNTGYRVLSDGSMEVSGQGRGKLLGIDAFIVFTTVGSNSGGIFMGEGNGVITTMDGKTVVLRMNSIGYPSENGGISRGASIQATDDEEFIRLNKTICLHEYMTDMNDEWTGKIWEWK